MLLCLHRALIPEVSIKSVDTNPKTLSMKRTASLVKATQELARHQELMKHVSATTHDADDNDNLSGADNDVDDEQVRFKHVIPVCRHKNLPFCF